MQKEQSRSYEYDLVRIFATILVVIGHSTYISSGTPCGFVHYDLPAELSTLYSPFSGLFNWIYSFHMPLFFLLSGAVLALRPMPPFSRLAEKKFKRLIIPYFLFGWLYMLPVKLIAGFYDIKSVGLAMKAFLTGTDSGHLWFLPALFWCMTVFALIFGILKGRNIYLAVFFCALIQQFAEKLPVDYLLLKMAMDYIFWFALGYCFETFRRRLSEYKSRRACTVKLLLLTAAVLFSSRYEIFTPEITIMVCSYWVYMLSLWLVRYLPRFVHTKFFAVLAQSSFTVYLLHDPLQYIVLRIAFSMDWLCSDFGCIAYYFCRTAGMYLFCVLVWLAADALKPLARRAAAWITKPDKIME